MYSEFSYVYDMLMDDVNYSHIADFFEALFRKYSTEKPELVLDLACGTGNLTLELSKRGYNMTGIDNSPDMLSCAVEKSARHGVSPLWVCQDMRSFELYGTMDAILCTMDGLNYITNIPDLEKVFRLVNNYLNPGGLFIFDMNTPYKLEKILGNNSFHVIRDDIAYLWINEYNPEKKLCTLDLTFFVHESGDLYRRLDERQEQKAWEIDDVTYALKKANLKLINVFDAFTENPPGETSERYCFVAAKSMSGERSN